MKKMFNWRTAFRWYVLFILLFGLAGCATIADYLGFDYDEVTGCWTWKSEKGELRPRRGCFFGPAEDVGQFNLYDSLRGPRRGSDISARDMGFEKDSDHYIPINKESSNN